MNPIRSFESRIVPLPVSNIDTDQIIPARFLKTVSKAGLGDQLFNDWRYDAEGRPRPDFILNQRRAQDAQVLLAGDNFGCGSSREHPSVGLAFAGIKAVICKSVNRIFYRSSVNQGLPIILVPEAVDAYKQGDKVDIDFARGIVTVGGKDYAFAPLPTKLMEIFDAKGLVNYVKNK